MIIEIKNLDYTVGALLALQGQLEDLTPLNDAIGAAMVSTTQQRFIDEQDPDSNKWEQLKPSTAKRKATKSHRRGYDHILRDSGQLYESITHYPYPDKVIVGTNVLYAETHQVGRDNIPARAFVGFSSVDEETTYSIIDDYLSEALT